MKPTGSPPTWVSSLPVAGFFHTISLECSARVIVILMSGPSGVMTPPLFMRGARFVGRMPSVTKEFCRPAGAHIGTLCFFASSGASPRWSPWAWVTRMRSTLPSASRFLYCAGVLGFVVSHGSITMTLPPGVVIFVAACPSHWISALPVCARAGTSASIAITVLGAPRDVAAHASVLFSALPNDEIVLDTYLGGAGVLAGARPGLVTCDCSTVTPETSQKIHAAARGRGVAHLDTPMLGSSPQAESGEVFFMVGGDRDQLATVQPLLDVIGRLTMYVGPSGTGNRIKLLHNALGAVNAVAVAESLALAERLGVDPQANYDVVRQGGGMAYSTYFDRRVMRVVEGNFDATFTVELMHKDVALAARMAGADLDRMPVLKETLAAYTAARAKWPGQDFSGVTHVVEERFGLKVSR